jgi:Spy/CpxP family protein refolding chaperone
MIVSHLEQIPCGCREAALPSCPFSPKENGAEQDPPLLSNRKFALMRFLLIAVATIILAATAAAQGRGTGGGMGGGMGGFGGMGRGNMPKEERAPTISNENQGGLQLGPLRRWWDDKNVARNVGLDSRQQHRMDDVFTANRDVLVKASKALQHEESQLQKLTRSKDLDENQIFQQIDRVTQARGDLEKATAHYLLQIRKEMSPEQTAKLDDLQGAPQ